MELILWRHAEAEDRAPDHERRLTERGHRQARAMAKWLKPRLPDGYRMLVSPAVRTQQTAQALHEDFDTRLEVGVGVPPRSVLQAAGWPAASGCCLVVGHQPTLGLVASQILCGVSDELTVQKSAIWWFAAASNKIVLRAALTPDMLGEEDLQIL